MIALLIDVGNTRIKWRITRLDGISLDGLPGAGLPQHAIRTIDVGDLEASFRAAAEAAPATVDLVLIANVASEATGSAVMTAASSVWPASAVQFVRASAAACGLTNAYRNPLQLGVDRWMAAIAAHALHPDRSVLICTFGTATTIDLVEHHRFVGGLILPGVDAMHAALTTSTARLAGTVGRVVDFGDRTDDAIASGVIAAQVGAVERTLRKVRARRQQTVEPLCIVAGGAASRVEALLDVDAPHSVIHDLVLRGLALVAYETAAAPSRVSVPAP